MPLRLYDNNDWRSPTNVRIYNNGWKDAKVGYVYNLGSWQVVYPDPIIPFVNVIDNGSWAEVNTVNVFYVQMIVNTSELESLVGELYSGSAATGTPIQTQTFNYSYILEGYEYYVRFYVSSPGTYTIKTTATSITGNSVSVVSQPISPILLSVNITSANLTRSTYSVSWNSVGQEEYFVGVSPIDGSSGILILQEGSSTSIRSASGGILSKLLGNTQYDLYVGIRRSGTFSYTQTSIRLTTPPGYAPAITNFSATSTCNSITATWTNNADIDTGVISISEVIGFEQSMPIYGNTQSFNFVAPQNSKTFYNLVSFNYLNNPAAGRYEISIYGKSLDNTQTDTQYLYVNTLAQSISAVPNFLAVSSFYGDSVSFTWSAPTVSCSTLSGYTIQYKLPADATWTTLSSTIAAGSTSYSSTLTYTANTTYDFRIFARGTPNNSTYSYSTITTNNNPYKIFAYTLPLGTTTFNSVTVYGQLQNISGVNVSNSGVSLSFSATANRGSFSSTSASTNSSGLASVTYTTNSTTGDIIFTVTGTGLVQDTYTMSVSLSSGLTPSLSTTRTNFGYDVTHSNYNSLYSYSGTVTNGGFNFDGIWGDSFYTIVIPPINTALPVASRNALVSVTCTPGTWTAQPSATTTVTSSDRPGYADASASVSNTPTGTLSYAYTWYYGNGELLGTGQTRSITSAMRGRNVYCIVVATRTGGTAGFQAQSDTISIPE